MSNLVRFTRIWVRDSVSRRGARSRRRCRDLRRSLLWFAVAAVARRQRHSCDRQRRRGDEEETSADRGPISGSVLSMKYAPGPAYRKAGWLRKRFSTTERESTLGITDFRKFAAYLANYDHLITRPLPRAMLRNKWGMPVSVIPSNTAKNEALLADVRPRSGRMFRSNPSNTVILERERNSRLLLS